MSIDVRYSEPIFCGSVIVSTMKLLDFGDVKIGKWFVQVLGLSRSFKEFKLLGYVAGNRWEAPTAIT